MRKISASESPTCRARFDSAGDRRDTRIEMNTTLSMPSTISSIVSVTKAAQALGSVRRCSIITL
jgi:hypothetical protein